ncbi:PucR family transcriptional regulator [Lutispora saccharofermentans]|uniref:PucR family transcriptional regulator ligand-binding domain-containing protein n=1 Tax=Lutispora saccharofermentans TaxID=3024236 RepID=A0ABT1NFS5_9FIRM|nr:PucR family transcriptional regulator [Lutispora saccharofermentans]MCQ1529008.1 PucR family transcriptional regulator ligand-binding domain-containing protein [Lutispora saccharofermentans]
MNDDIKNIIVDMKKVKTDYAQESLSVEEVLNLPTLNGYKLLAGGTGLQKRCKNMTILETPEGISWLQGEEFLITAGYAFTNNEHFKKAMLIDANCRGVSAIAIKENRYFGEISQELIEQANKFEIPLIQIPYDVIYTSAIASFYNMLFYRKNEYILKLNDIYEKLLNLSFENKDIDGIIYSLSNLSNSNVFLFDGSLNLMCYNIINASSFDRLSAISPFNKRGIELIRHIKDYTLNEELYGSFVSMYPILIRNKNVAYVYIINDFKLDKLAQSSIEYGISIIAMKLELDQTTSIAKTRINKTLLEIMLNNNKLPDGFYQNAELNLNWNYEGFIFGLCIKLYVKEDNNIEDCKFIIYNCLNNIIEKNNYLSTDKNTEIFLFIKINSGCYLEDFISSLVERIKIYEDIFTYSIGVSKPYKDIRSIKRLYDEAYLAILFSNCDIIYYNTLDTIKLLYPLKEDKKIQEYYNRTIKKLEKYDEEHGTNLLETIEVYLKYNLKKTTVSRKLYIHVETLRYRLNRIEEITGYSLDDSEGLFALQLGIKLKRLIKVN